MSLPGRRATTSAFLAGALAVAGPGCSGGTAWRSFVPGAPAPALPGTPEEVLRALETSWTQRDSAAFGLILNGGFQFVFSALDTAGSPWRTRPWGRAEELRSLGHMFHGGDVSQPPVTDLVIVLDQTFAVLPDPRPAHSDPRIWRTIRSRIAVDLTDATGAARSVSGGAQFYFVRGDSAPIRPGAPPRADTPRPLCYKRSPLRP